MMMFVALIVLISLIGCYLALGLEIIIARQMFKGKEAEVVDLLAWPFLLIADLVVYLLYRFCGDWLKTITYRDLP
jgi:hypothetical protein